MIAISYTAMKDAQCPFRFNALRIAKTFKEPETDPMRVGSSVHECLEKYLKHCFSAGVETDYEWLSKYSFPDDIADKCSPMIETFRDRMGFTVPIAARWRAIEGKAAYNDFLLPLPGDDGWFSKQAAFRAVVDFAYVYGDTLYVVDWKTGRGDPDPFQTEIYAYLIPKLLPDAFRNQASQNQVTRVACVFGELAKGRMTTAGEFPVGDGVGQETHQKIVEWIEKVNAWTEFPAVACDQCRWCRVPDCPVRSGVGQAIVDREAKPRAPVLSIPTQIKCAPDAEKAVQFVAFAERIIDQVKDLLRDWVEEHGPVSSGGKIAELRENAPWKAGDVEKILKLLLAYGIPKSDVLSALSVSESSLKSLLKKQKLMDRLPMVLAMGERKQYKPKFGLHHIKEDEF